MILHKINFEIDFETTLVSEEKYIQMMNFFMDKMKENNPQGFSFEELNKIIPLSSFKFYPAAIDCPDFEYADPDMVITKETKIEIRA
jgi:hypothetical protein